MPEHRRNGIKMSFSSQVKSELNSIHIKNNCCKKAYLYGAMLAAEHERNSITLTLTDESSVEQICFLLRSIYKIIPEKKIIKRGCYCATVLKFESSRLADFIAFADSFSADCDNNDKLHVFFTCPNCAMTFLRATFCTRGSVSNPLKSYSLEIQTLNESRSAIINKITEDCGLTPQNFTKRGSGFGLFYRNEASIEDFLTAIGAGHMLFSFFNSHIEKDIRNAENRATNCVAKNILKSVEAIGQQITAIEKLKECGHYDELSTEIKTTAELRLDNPEATLSELALLHDPPISKSGLNHRIAKIINEAKRRKLI